jgi:Polyketide cyclase / dehydrase and lipid transport
MSETISFKDTIQIRGRPDVLFRSVMDPRRRTRWDPNVREAKFQGEERLGQGTLVRIKLPTRMLGLSFIAKYGQYQAPHRGGWESVRPFGPLERLTQGWVFKPLPGGTEVTLHTTARVRFKWIARPIERVLRSANAQTLLELQRQVDAQGAAVLEEAARDYADKQRAARKQKKSK